VKATVAALAAVYRVRGICGTVLPGAESQQRHDDHGSLAGGQHPGKGGPDRFGGRDGVEREQARRPVTVARPSQAAPDSRSHRTGAEVRRGVADPDAAADVVGSTIAEFIPRQVMHLRQILNGFPLI
jgi:hypothetical protein